MFLLSEERERIYIPAILQIAKVKTLQYVNHVKIILVRQKYTDICIM
jgi:hypothetical protein